MYQILDIKQNIDIGISKYTNIDLDLDIDIDLDLDMDVNIDCMYRLKY